MIANALTNADAISAPTFFATNTALFQDSIAAIQFGFTGVGVAPCAIPITPLGVGIFPQVPLSLPSIRSVQETCQLKGVMLRREER